MESNEFSSISVRAIKHRLALNISTKQIAYTPFRYRAMKHLVSCTDGIEQVLIGHTDGIEQVLISHRDEIANMYIFLSGIIRNQTNPKHSLAE